MSKVKLEIRKPYLPLWKQTSGEKAKRYVIIMGGRGGGRSTAASQLLTTKLFGHDYLRAAIMRSVQTDIRPSNWSEIIDRIDEMDLRGAVDIKENAMTIKRGKNIIQAHGFKASSGSNSAKLKSLASYNTVWIEEAEEIGEEEFMKLDDSLRTTKGTITVVLTLNTPAKNHWIIERFFDLKDSEIDEFYEPVLKKEREKDTLYIRTNYTDNKKNLDESTISRYEEYKQTKPDYYAQAILGLSPEVVRGKIFSGWRRIGGVPFEAKLERIGIDWGWYPDPLAIVAVYRHQGGFILDEVGYSQRISNDQAASIIRNYLGNKVALIVADSAEPKSIEELQSYALNVLPAEKGPGSLDSGIKMMCALQISVTERSHNIWREYENYAWREDRDGNPLGVPLDRNNHCFAPDSLIYTTKGKKRIQDLVGKTGYLYSRNGSVQKFSHVRPTRKDAEMVRLTFDDGQVLSVTTDHLLLQPDGTWIEAGLLTESSLIQSGTYGTSRANLRGQSVSPLSWRAILQSWKQTLTQGRLGAHAREDSETLPCSPQGQQHAQQLDRKPGTTESEAARTGAHDQGEERTAERVGGEDSPPHKEVAFIARGEGVAQVTWNRSRKETKGRYEEVRSLWERLSNKKSCLVGTFLSPELQNESPTKKVERIERERCAVTYNLEVENTECLVVDGVVAHNSIDAVRYALTDIKPHVDTESRMEKRMKRLYSNRRKLVVNQAR